MLHTTRAKYWLNFNDYFFALKSFINSKRNLRKKIYAISVYSMTYTEHLFNIGFLEDYYQFKDSKAQIDNFSFNGFFSQSFTTKKESSGKRQLFLQDSVNFLKKKELVKNLDFDQNVLNKSQVLHLERINDLIMLAESKGVKLFIVLMPNFRRRIKPIIPIFNCIDSKNRIEIGNPGKYPELYSQHLFYEGKHYNLNGAQTFTKMFTNKFLQKINN